MHCFDMIDNYTNMQISKNGVTKRDTYNGFTICLNVPGGKRKGSSVKCSVAC